MRCCGFHLIAISRKILKIFIVEMSLKFTNLRLWSNLPGANELMNTYYDLWKLAKDIHVQTFTSIPFTTVNTKEMHSFNLKKGSSLSWEDQQFPTPHIVFHTVNQQERCSQRGKFDTKCSVELIMTNDKIPLDLYALMNGCLTTRSLEAARLNVTMIISLWNLTGIWAVLLPRCLLNFITIGKF